MATFLTLPAELRQQILHLTFPDTIIVGIPLPSQVTTLLEVCCAIQSDTLSCIATWSPIHYINCPQDIAALNPPSITISNKQYTPKLTRLALNIFHKSSINVIFWTCACTITHSGFHTALLHAWRDAIPHLPPLIEFVALDITPAPAATRGMHPLALYSVVQDRRAQNFVDRHIVKIGQVLEAVYTHFSGKIEIELRGMIGTPRVGSRRHKGKSWPGEIVKAWNRTRTGTGPNSNLNPSLNTNSRKEAVHVPFTGTFISQHQAHIANITRAVEGLRPKKVYPPHARLPFRKFSTVKWSHEARWIYAKLAYDGEESAVQRDIREMCEFEVRSGQSGVDGDEEGTEKLVYGPMRGMRRALVHWVARDIGLKTWLVRGGEGEGEGMRKEIYVVVRRKAQGDEGDGGDGNDAKEDGGQGGRGDSDDECDEQPHFSGGHWCIF